MECGNCKNLMKLVSCDKREYWICEPCSVGFLANPKKDCEHNNDSITFGINNVAWCEDCGNNLCYESIIKTKG